jgi:hypothetical protein
VENQILAQRCAYLQQEDRREKGRQKAIIEIIMESKKEPRAKYMIMSTDVLTVTYAARVVMMF